MRNNLGEENLEDLILIQSLIGYLKLAEDVIIKNSYHNWNSTKTRYYDNIFKNWVILEVIIKDTTKDPIENIPSSRPNFVKMFDLIVDIYNIIFIKQKLIK